MLFAPMKNALKVATLPRVIEICNRAHGSTMPVVGHDGDICIAHEGSKNDADSMALVSDVQVRGVCWISVFRSVIVVPVLGCSVILTLIMQRREHAAHSPFPSAACPSNESRERHQFAQDMHRRPYPSFSAPSR